MEQSLTVPTATSVRAVPAKLLFDNRIVINNHLKRNKGGKVSFTHLIGYALVRALRPGGWPDLRPALRIESYRTDCTDALVALCREARLELAWFASDFGRLEDLRQHDPAALGAEARRLALDPAALALQLEAAALRRREVPRHLCRLAEALDEARARYGSIGDTGGAMRETHSMIGAGLAACPAAPSAAAAARATR